MYAHYTHIYITIIEGEVMNLRVGEIWNELKKGDLEKHGGRKSICESNAIIFNLKCIKTLHEKTFIKNI